MKNSLGSSRKCVLIICIQINVSCDARRSWCLFWVTGGPRRAPRPWARSRKARPSRRPSLFQGVTKWGTPWPRAKSRGTGRGEASPVRNALKWPGREPWNRRKDVMTFSIEIVKEGFMSKKYAFSGRTVKINPFCVYYNQTALNATPLYTIHMK